MVKFNHDINDDDLKKILEAFKGFSDNLVKLQELVGKLMSLKASIKLRVLGTTIATLEVNLSESVSKKQEG